MQKLTRQEILSQAAKKLRQDFDELLTVPHSALKGHEAEKLVRKFLADHLPKRFGVGSGFIIDQRDEISKQTDVVIYDAFNCPTYRVSDDAAIFPSDNVAAVIEVKSRLDKKELEDAFKNIQQTKALSKTTPPDVPFYVKSQTLGCLFAFDSAISMDKVAEHYTSLIRKHGIGHHIDIIVVLDKGIITLSAKLRGFSWNTAIIEGMGGPYAEGSHIGIGNNKLKEDSLDGFLLLLLANLIPFRGMTPHPGFNWQDTASKGEVKLTYLMSITTETDPILKKRKLKEYETEVMEEFAKHPVPSNGE